MEAGYVDPRNLLFARARVRDVSPRVHDDINALDGERPFASRAFNGSVRAPARKVGATFTAHDPTATGQAPCAVNLTPSSRA